jgi:ribosomal protein S18 acetylase RimI-like enzyme
VTALPTLQWRLAENKDAEQISAIVNSAYRGETGLHGWTTEAGFIGGPRVNASQVREMVAAPGNFILVACMQGDPDQLLGCVHVEKHDGEAHFGMLAVNVELQARGVGAFLLKAAEDFARDRLGARKMMMTVIGRRTELIAWYERRGYRATGETQPFPYGDERVGVPLVEGLFFRVFEKPLTDRMLGE